MAKQFKKEKVEFEDAADNSLCETQSKKNSGVRNLVRKLRNAVGREMKNVYVAGNSLHDAYPNNLQSSQLIGQDQGCCINNFSSNLTTPKELYEKRQRNARSEAQVKNNKPFKQTKRHAKMELRRVFGSTRDTVIAPLILEQTNSAMEQDLNIDSKECKTAAKSKLKRVKELARLSKKELKYVRVASSDSRIIPL